MSILPPHDRKVFAEFADKDCPRCLWIRRIELAGLLIIVVLEWFT